MAFIIINKKCGDAKWLAKMSHSSLAARGGDRKKDAGVHYIAYLIATPPSPSFSASSFVADLLFALGSAFICGERTE